MIATLAMLAISAGCAVYLFLKGTLTLGITMILNVVIAGFLAFGFFELTAQYLVKYSPGMIPWAHAICFLLILVLGFALLQTVVMQLSVKEKVDFGKLPEQIGRPVAGVILGYLVTGYLLVAGALAPVPNQYPYLRFSERSPNPASPTKPLLSPDGFVTGLFATVSKGSFSAISNPRSFGLLHAGYLDQLYLNRHKVDAKIPLTTAAPALEVQGKNSVWYAPDNLRDTEGKPLAGQAGTSLMLVRTGIRRSAMRDTSKFTLSQVRLVCAPKGVSKNPLGGTGEAVYPVGYIGANGRLERKSLVEVLAAESPEAQPDAVTMDLAFYVPTNSVPVLLEFRRNNVVQLPAPAKPEDAPQPIPFGAPAPPPQATPQPAPPAPEPQAPTAQPQTPAPQSAAPAPTSPSSPDNQKKKRGLSDFSRSVVGDEVQEN